MCLRQLRLPPKCFISLLFAFINAVPVPIEAIIAFCLFEAVRPPKPIALNSSIYRTGIFKNSCSFIVPTPVIIIASMLRGYMLLFSINFFSNFFGSSFW